jgi:hypothetical protein
MSNRIYNPENDLPNENEYVLAYFGDRPWHDADDKDGLMFWVVVKFEVGISKKERDLLLSSGDKRGLVITGSDEHGNNKRPYSWSAAGPAGFRGQECKCWTRLPKPLAS